MKTIALLFLELSLTLMGYAQVSKTVNVAIAGGLLSALTETELTTVTNLTVTGTIDAQDFLTMRDKMTKLAILHISGVNIVAYTGTLGTAGTSNTEYPANTIPKSSFKFKRSMTSITLPASITSIGDQAFFICEGLLSISFPASLTSIGSFSFSGCTSLTSVYIPSSVINIGELAFNYSLCSIIVDSNNPNYSSIDGVLFNKTQTIIIYCPITKTGIYIIPQSVTTIENYAFDGCVDLTNVTIPSSVTIIGNGAFYICTGLTSITFSPPSTVTSIGDYSFYNCSGLASIDIPATVSSIGDYAFSYCRGLTSIYIPSSVSLIGLNAFSLVGGPITIDPGNPNYSSVDGMLLNKTQTTLWQCPVSKTGECQVPQTVTSIAPYAFDGCVGLTALLLPSALAYIGSGSFRGCTGLTSVTIPALVDTIRNHTFYGCTGLTSVTLSSSVTLISSYVFYKCTSLTSVAIPASVTTIGSYTFYGCTGLTSVLLPLSVVQIGVSAFEGCTGLSSITIPPAVTTIDKYTFYGCTGLTSVIIPSSVTTIESSAFDGCKSLTSLTVPSLVAKIGQYAFYGCKSLTTINIPSMVTSIGSSAFSGCSGLNSVYSFVATPIDLSTSYSAFYKVNKSTCILYVPVGSKSAYQVADQWEDFENIVEFATGLHAKEIPAISLLPNPFTEGFWISGIEGSAKISIIDINGKIQFTKHGLGNEFVSLKSLPQGVFIVRISTAKGIIEKKMIKQ